ncbi:MAG: hypothetical protein MUF54_01035 [Polyangiaceae bacterium]|nr:hypothetical protein [Polyangiaceae bacterium]
MSTDGHARLPHVDIMSARMHLLGSSPHTPRLICERQIGGTPASYFPAMRENGSFQAAAPGQTGEVRA